MKKRSIIGIFATVITVMLVVCSSGAAAQSTPDLPEPEAPVEVNRTYEKIDPSPAVEAPSYDLNLKIDTENDRITEEVRIDIQNNTDVPVDSVYLRFYPMGYFGYLCEKEPDAAEANKDKKAEITGIRFDGTDEELSAEYFMDDTSVKVNLAETAMQPGEKRTLVIEAWTDIPDAPQRFGMIRHEQRKLYLLSFFYPYVECSSEGMWQVDPPLYLGGEGENRNPDLKTFHVEMEVPENFTVACAGTAVRENGIVSFDLENIRDLAIAVSDFMDADTFETQGVTIRSYYLTAGNSKAYREIAKQVVKDGFEYFTDLLGNYPRAEYTLIQGVDGMEHSGLAFVEGQTFLNDQDEIANKLQRNIAHEIGHSWFYDSVGNNEYREGWIDEGICTYIVSDELLYNDIESYKTETKYGSDGSLESYTSARDWAHSNDEKYDLEGLDHLYLNEPWDVFPDNISQTEKEYGVAPIFLRHVKEIMGQEVFYGFLREVYETYTLKIVHSEDILKILRKYNDSEEINELIDFYFDSAISSSR